MRQFEPIMMDQVDLFIEQISAASKLGRPMDMTPPLKYLGMDVICLLAFGHSLKTQSSSTNRFVIDGIVNGHFFSNIQIQVPFIKTLRLWKLFLLIPKFQAARERHELAIASLIATRLAEEQNARHDFYSAVMGAADDGTTVEGIRSSELWSEAGVFLSAGLSPLSSLAIYTDIDGY
jgi:hypothetical protein